MIVIAAIVIGGLTGWRRARALGGGRKDVAQYVAVFAVIFAILGVLATVLIERLA